MTEVGILGVERLDLLASAGVEVTVDISLPWQVAVWACLLGN